MNWDVAYEQLRNVLERVTLTEAKNLFQVFVVSLTTWSWRPRWAGTFWLDSGLRLGRLLLSAEPATRDLFGRACVLLGLRHVYLSRIIVIHEAVDKRFWVLVLVIDTQEWHSTFIEPTKTISVEIVTALRQEVDMLVQDALRLVEFLLLCHSRRGSLDQVAISRATSHAFLVWRQPILSSWSTRFILIRRPSVYHFSYMKSNYILVNFFK